MLWRTVHSSGRGGGRIAETFAAAFAFFAAGVGETQARFGIGFEDCMACAYNDGVVGFALNISQLLKFRGRCESREAMPMGR